jgi:ABC-type branched-subunit amino acid transport system substrate-binding protein
LARGFGIAQDVPNPYKNAVPLVREHREVMATYAPAVKINFYTLGGYAVAKVTVEALKRAGPAPTRAKVIAALETMQGVDIGGMQYSYGKDLRLGTKYVDLLIIDSKGEIQGLNLLGTKYASLPGTDDDRRMGAQPGAHPNGAPAALAPRGSTGDHPA